MTAVALRAPARASVRPLVAAVGLVGVVGLRWAATVHGFGDALAIGLAFGGALLVLALGTGQPVARPRPSSIPVGLAGAAVLVALAVVAHLGAPGPSFAPAAAFLPWAAITTLVATAEELVLRGVLFDALDRLAGLLAAIVLTSVLFALIHVPLYGWHVVPLDLAVGVWLAGLRLLSGGVAAPAIAHTLADLATWWL